MNYHMTIYDKAIIYKDDNGLIHVLDITPNSNLKIREVEREIEQKYGVKVKETKIILYGAGVAYQIDGKVKQKLNSTNSFLYLEFRKRMMIAGNLRMI